MKPIIILPKGQMSAKDVEKLNDNGLCVVEAEDPSKVQFVDPLPAASSRTQIENAAIQLSRRMLHGEVAGAYKGDISSLFVKLLSEGTPLSSKPTEEEVLAAERRDAMVREARRLGAEDARRERDERSKAKAAEKALREKEKAEAKAK